MTTYLGHAKYRKLSVKYLIDLVINLELKKKNLSIKFLQFIRLEKEKFQMYNIKMFNYFNII